MQSLPSLAGLEAPQKGRPNTFRSLICVSLLLMHFNQPFPRSMRFKTDSEGNMLSPEEKSTGESLCHPFRMCVLFIAFMILGRVMDEKNRFATFRMLWVGGITMAMHSPIYSELAFKLTQNVMLKILHSAVLCDYLTDVIVKAMGYVANVASLQQDTMTQFALTVVASFVLHVYEYIDSVPSISLPSVNITWDENKPEVSISDGQEQESPAEPAPPAAQNVSDVQAASSYMETYGPSVILITVSAALKFVGLDQRNKGDTSIATFFEMEKQPSSSPQQSGPSSPQSQSDNQSAKSEDNAITLPSVETGEED